MRRRVVREPHRCDGLDGVDWPEVVGRLFARSGNSSPTLTSFVAAGVGVATSVGPILATFQGSVATAAARANSPRPIEKRPHWLVRSSAIGVLQVSSLRADHNTERRTHLDAKRRARANPVADFISNNLDITVFVTALINRDTPCQVARRVPYSRASSLAVSYSSSWDGRHGGGAPKSRARGEGPDTATPPACRRP